MGASVIITTQIVVSLLHAALPLSILLNGAHCNNSCQEWPQTTLYMTEMWSEVSRRRSQIWQSEAICEDVSFTCSLEMSHQAKTHWINDEPFYFIVAYHSYSICCVHYMQILWLLLRLHPIWWMHWYITLNGSSGSTGVARRNKKKKKVFFLTPVVSFMKRIQMNLCLPTLI